MDLKSLPKTINAIDLAAQNTGATKSRTIAWLKYHKSFLKKCLNITIDFPYQ